ncbi:MAG: M24 family metallopeptidase [Bacillota bacterium]|jgi:Xaa-Pro aminopeptidase
MKLTRIRQEMANAKVDGIIVLEPNNRRYLSGFTGTAANLLITADQAFLITDFRYIEQATAQAPDFKIVKSAGGATLQPLVDLIREKNVRRVAFEPDYLVFDGYNYLREALGSEALVPLRGVVEKIRQIKDAKEIELIRKAQSITEQALEKTLPLIKPGISEREIALELETWMRRLGASKTGFDTIIASGTRSSLPHGVASDKLIEKGDFVTIDCGAVYQGYCGDLTRTYVVGEANDEQRRIYDIVLKAQMAALNGLKAGITGRVGDSFARSIINGAGYEENFGHGLGHCVGLAIHENPRLSPADETVLQAGMVITVEPGIYIPGWGGVRIEDTVAITENGIDNLTTIAKDLRIL